MQTEKIIIENLKCHGCANSIRQAIQQMTGVEEVAVEQENSTVTIQHDGSVMRTGFVATLSRLGYPEQGNSTLIHKAKSYVSCAVGRLK